MACNQNKLISCEKIKNLSCIFTGRFDQRVNIYDKYSETVQME